MAEPATVTEIAIPQRQAKKRTALSTGTSIIETTDMSPELRLLAQVMTDRDLPIERVSQAYDLYQRVRGEEAYKAFNAAFAQMQPNIPATVRRGEIKHNEKRISAYARYEDIVDDITPVLAAHGFSLRHRTKNEPGKIIVTGILAHREGHAEETTLELPADTSGAKNPVQAIGSSVSYARRYTASVLLNLVSCGEDDDGQSGAPKTANGLVSDVQATALQRLIDETRTPVATFYKLAKIKSRTPTVSDVRAQDYDMLVSFLEMKKSKQQ